MSEMTLAMSAMTAVATLCGLLAVRWHPRGDHLVLGITLMLVAVILFSWHAMGELFWARWMPTSAAIAWSNFTPVPLAICAGWLWRLPDRPLWRRAMFAGLLAILAVGAVMWPILGPMVRPPQPSGNKWVGPVALQTQWANCSPAAAATLLATADISASEAEMVRLCLTDSRGTPPLGLYRGLKIKADANGKELTVLSATVGDVISEVSLPAVLLVELPLGVDDPRYERDWGWIPGVGHSVVCFERNEGGRWLIGDPSVGIEVWTDDDLRLLWKGEGIAIKP